MGHNIRQNIGQCPKYTLCIGNNTPKYKIRSGSAASPPEKGVLDLSSWDFSRDGIVTCDGRLKSYWGHIAGCHTL